MVLSLKVGYLVPGVVIKSMPYHDSHLILISGTEFLALLPRKYANKPYKIGQNLLACVFMLESDRIILSQRCHHYYKRIAERSFGVLIEEEKIRIRRAATVTGAGFVKMAVEGLDGVDPIKECLPYLPAIKPYTDDTITLVRYSRDIKEYIKSALAPAPTDKVRKVIYSSTLREAIVGVDPTYYGLFVGKGGANVATAAKLLDITILIKKTEDTML